MISRKPKQSSAQKNLAAEDEMFGPQEEEKTPAAPVKEPLSVVIPATVPVTVPATVPVIAPSANAPVDVPAVASEMTSRPVARKRPVVPGSSRRHQRGGDGPLQFPRRSFRRLARRGGVKRIGTKALDVAMAYAEKYMHDVIKTAIAYMEHCKRTTCTARDVITAIRRSQNCTLFGLSD